MQLLSRYVIVDLLNVKWNTFISKNTSLLLKMVYPKQATRVLFPGRKFYTQFFTFFLFFILSSSVFLLR